MSQLRPRVDKIGWILSSFGIFFIFLGVGYSFYSFPKSSSWSSVFLGIGVLLAITVILYQLHRQNQMEQNQNTKGKIGKMNRISALIILSVISVLPMLSFLLTDFRWHGNYYLWLLTGQTRISINLARNWFDVYGVDFLGTTRLPLTYALIVIISFAIFCTSIAFIMQSFYHSRKKRL